MEVGLTQTEFVESNVDDDHQGFSMILMLAILLGLFVAWALIFEFDTTVRANGKLVPRARTQIIQVADGGVLSQILVREGTLVEKGQLLAVLEKERASANFEEEKSRVASLEIALLRAQAEIKRIVPSFDDFLEGSPDIVKAQSEYYLQRKLKLQKQIGILGSSLEIAMMELNMNKRLLESGDASRIEVMKAQQQVNDVRGKILEERNKYLDDAHQEITRTEADLRPLRYKLGVANSVLSHTEIVSPVAGVVKYLGINTLGGVLRAGDELMQISPSEGGLMLEAKVMPTDIGQLSIGMPVFIKLEAFDYSIYGNLHGTLNYLSSDTLTEKDESGREIVFYSVQVNIDEDHLRDEPKLASVILKAGMNATIDIKTGSKTVFNYLSKPITKTFSGAIH
ncbi:MAG: secretion protein [Gammaproteobacteria bacterium]|nr:MAG: secretion protein [Gammaproteobacteria bacterium]